MRRPIKTTKYYLSKDIEDAAVRTELEELFGTLETNKRVAVEEYRKAAEVLADLDIARAKTMKAMGQFLRKAGDYIPMVAVEPVWWAYRTKEGEIVLECAVTERDIRNAQRAQKAGLAREVQSTDGEGLFEDEGEEHTENPTGF